MTDTLPRFIALLVEHRPDKLSALGAAILASVHFGICRDSRSFARVFGIAHALVLRECVALCEDQDLIELENRKERSQRLFYALSPGGLSLIREAA
ncbi:MAG: hypothetical protein AAGF82_02115 [Pseudomonadota bacterium]